MSDIVVEPAAPDPADKASEPARPFAERAKAWARERLKPRPGSRVPGPLKVLGALLLFVVLAAVLFLLFADWNMLRGPIGRYASARLDRTVELRGDLQVHPWSLTPRAEINDLYVADTPWSGTDHLARVGRVEVAVKLLPLLKGDFILQRLALVKPDINLARDGEGRANWRFKEEKSKEPGELPIVRQLFITDGRIRYRDKQRGLTVDAAAEASETAEGGGFRLTGDGRINTGPFRLRVSGGPLIYMDKDRPYPFDARIDAGDTRLTARGDITEPFDLARFQSRFDLSGADLNELYGITGLALPNTPPYRVRGRLERRGTLYQVQNLSGTVGDSDLAGSGSIETKGERPLLKAELRSRRLDFDDLLAVFGGAPDPRETANARQKALAGRQESQGRLLPDATLQVERVRAMDAEVTYRAASVLAPSFPMRDAAVAVDLKNGMLKLTDIRFSFAQGRLTGTAQIDARRKTPLVDTDLRVTGLRLEQFLTRTGAQPISGALVARAKLSGSGNSVHRFAANADGSITLVVPGGQVREAFAELVGINVIKGLGLLLSKDTGTTELRCAVADFRVQDGQLFARQIVADTEPVLVTGSGGGSLDTETLNIVLKGNPKKFRLVSLNAPVTIQGPIRKPSIGVRPGGAIAQGGVAAALGALVNPIAAILPFVDPGLAKDANCSALLSGARSKGAPVQQRAR